MYFHFYIDSRQFKDHVFPSNVFSKEEKT